MIRPKKSLGQNFLRDDNIANAIVNALDAQSGDTIIEIGPGTGALTSRLAALPVALIAVELDPRAVEELRRLFPHQAFPNVTIVAEDILKCNFTALLRQHGASRAKIVGNIPYYITSDILFRIFENAPLFERAVIMMQREVAERLVAHTRTKEYGILSVATAFATKPKKLFNVPPTCFFPVPNVESAVVQFDCTERLVQPERFALLMKLVRAAFSQRRKVLSNAMKTYCASINKSLPPARARQRAEELSPQEFIELYDELHT